MDQLRSFQKWSPQLNRALTTVLAGRLWGVNGFWGKKTKLPKPLTNGETHHQRNTGVNTKAYHAGNTGGRYGSGWATRWSTRVLLSADSGVLCDQICTTFGPVILRGKLTFDERVVLHRVLWILYEKGIKFKLSGSEVYCTNSLILLGANMLCSNLHR